MADRYVNFTERARKVMELAADEARRFSHDYIGTEHLLLGIVRESDGVAAKVLQNLGVELRKVRSSVEFIIGHSDVRDEHPSLTPRAEAVLDLARDEARLLNHYHIGTEHLLLGLALEGEGIAAGVLESLGVNLERLRAEMTRILSPSMPSPRVAAHRLGQPPASVPAEALDAFAAGFGVGMALSREARMLLVDAADEARRLGATEITADHLLLALLGPGGGRTAAALARAGVDVAAFRAGVSEKAVALAAALEELARVQQEKNEAIAVQEYERAAQFRDQELKLMTKIERMRVEP